MWSLCQLPESLFKLYGPKSFIAPWESDRTCSKTAETRWKHEGGNAAIHDKCRLMQHYQAQQMWQRHYFQSTVYRCYSADACWMMTKTFFCLLKTHLMSLVTVLIWKRIIDLCWLTFVEWWSWMFCVYPHFTNLACVKLITTRTDSILALYIMFGIKKNIKCITETIILVSTL